jgi:imidazolonepropionase-like amidohydrolase
MIRPRFRPALVAALALAVTSFASAQAASPRVHALVGARIVTEPGVVISRGTIVIRDGVIATVGANVSVPADARLWNAESLTVYPGMIDAYLMPDAAPSGTAVVPSRGAKHNLASVTPERRVAADLPLPRAQLESLRAAGFAVAQVVPRSGIFRGRSAVVALGNRPVGEALIRPDAAQVVAFESQSGGYPGSLMGAIAVVRQTFSDARWYREAHAARERDANRPEVNEAFAALGPAVARQQRVLLAPADMIEVMRASTLAKELGLDVALVTPGEEYKRIRELAGGALPVVTNVNFPEAPDVSDAALALEIPIEMIRHWDAAPGNPAALRRAGLRLSLTANGLKDVKSFRAQVVKAIERGLSPNDALAAVTTEPARLLGLSERLGRIAPGYAAHLTVTRGDLFSEEGEVRGVWVDGDRYDVPKDDPLAGRWALAWERARHTLIVAAGKDTSIRLLVGADTLVAREARLEARRLRFTVSRGAEPAEAFDLRSDDGRLLGTLSVAGVGSHDVVGVRMRDEPKTPKKPRPRDPLPVPVVMGNTEPWRLAAPPQPAAILVRHATVWTAGPRGTLEDADVLVRAGKIAGVGRGLSAPAGALVIDAQGKHVAPGIIDEHSHSAAIGSVNECTNSVTAEVRVADIVNSESIQIYRQLAGGATVMHVLHGSCNAIGGQCVVLRNKWGEAPDRLVFTEAPPTIKFALGENPKRSNWSGANVDRFPNSRGGVEQVIREAFVRARDYRARWAEYRASKRGAPPRIDNQLEALAEVVEGKRIVHCHSYRQDEILMLMRVAEEFGFRIGTFTHVLEGYKVADELAAHGAIASSFSDWWAYKHEVMDAIPHSGYLMWDRGVVVCYNSDSNHLARRLNTEAAKAVKYGGVPPEEAIKFVTLNPAISLGIQARVGSLEVGKDADFAIWSGSPLSYASHCEQTWIEGRKYFDRAEELAARPRLDDERRALIARILDQSSGGKSASEGAEKETPRYLLDADRTGNACGAADLEAEAAAHEGAEVRR